MASRCYSPTASAASTCRPLRTPEGLCFVHRAAPGSSDVDIACPSCMYGRLTARPPLALTSSVPAPTPMVRR